MRDKIEAIKQELLNRGYETIEEKETERNNVKRKSLVIKKSVNDEFCPVYYLTDEILEDDVDTICDNIEKAISSSSMNIDIMNVLSKDFILENVKIGLQRTSNEDILKRETIFNSIEKYLYISGKRNDKYWSIRLNTNLIEKAGLSEEEVWKQASSNTFKESDFVIADLNSIMRQFGFEQAENIELYVVTNADRHKGAVQVLNKELLKRWGKANDISTVCVLPSSIHEVLIMPYMTDENTNTFSKIVKDVNSSLVDPIEQLSDKAYILDIS